MEEEHKHEKEALTIRDVARKLKVSTKTLRKWKRTGVLRPIRLVGIHPLRYTNEQIDQFVDEHTINDRPEQ